MADRTCTVDGCENTPRSKSADLCPKHYHRWYRHGSVHRTANGAGISASKGRRYRTVAAAGHPLANANGRAYEHRIVLFDCIGYGPHLCHWCGTTVHWVTKGEPGCLTVDHINSIGDDNRPENLVPACVACNTTRGQQAKAAALRVAGWWSNHDTIAHLRTSGRRDPLPLA